MGFPEKNIARIGKLIFLILWLVADDSNSRWTKGLKHLEYWRMMEDSTGATVRNDGDDEKPHLGSMSTLFIVGRWQSLFTF